MATITEKVGRGPSTSIDKTATDGSLAKGLGGKQRTSNFEIMPQTPGQNASSHDANIAESK